MSEVEPGKVRVVQAPESFVGVDIFQAAMVHPDLPFELEAIVTDNPDLRGKKLGETYLASSSELADVPLVTMAQAENTDAEVVFSSYTSRSAGRSGMDLAAGRLWLPLSVPNSQPDAPIVNSFVNGSHIDELYGHGSESDDPENRARDKVINSGNSLAALVSVPLAPLHRAIGIESVSLDTLQGWSDTGMTQTPSLLADAMTHTGIHAIHRSKNEGVEADIKRVLGASLDNFAAIDFSNMSLHHGSWHRGHYAKITAQFGRDTSKEEIENEWRHFEAPEAVEDIRSQLKVISQLGGERWPRGHRKIMPVKLEYGNGELLSSNVDETCIKRMHPMRVMVHMLDFDPEEPRKVIFELTGDSLVEGSVGNGLLNALYARAQGYLS